MVRKKLDERIRTLIERGVATGQRSLLVLVGDYGKDQVPNLHQLLSKMSVRARPKVLWCYKKELGFSTHRKKRMKKMKRDKARGLAKGNHNESPYDNDTTADNFELFITSTEINWCYYRDTHRILGSTTGMLVLQDFEALTPNLMARTIETVEGGGLVIFLMRTVTSLKQLYTMTMDVHARYRTEAFGDVVPRFNERFILSLGKCTNCLVCDDELNVLPLSKSALAHLNSPVSITTNGGIEKGDAGEVLTRRSKADIELQDLKEALQDTPHVGVLIDLAKTLDQARAILTFLEACSEKTSRSTIALTAARGRGKSAAIGLCLVGAISYGYSTILVTAPEPENLVAVFDFCIRGLKALKYQEHLDYTITYSPAAAGREHIKCVLAIEVHRDHKQSIKYVSPTEPDKFATAELVAIDEAAAIPLPAVRALMGDRLTFISSTVNGYEGTGRALSLKLLKELRDSKGRVGVDNVNAATSSAAGPKMNKSDAKVHEQRRDAASKVVERGEDSITTSGPLHEIELSTPIRYAAGDPVEAWLNKLLCLNCGYGTGLLKFHGRTPAPSDCELYIVDRDALFSYHKLSETFLQKLMGLYTSAHYKNTPNDLQMLSDAPAHSVFVLLSPSAELENNSDDSLPDILAVVQVALEGKISRKAVEAQLARGHRSAGDLIPWTISQQFGDANFSQLSGARIVRVAVHPSVQGMGYGSRAIELLYQFYNGEMMSLNTASGGEGDNLDGEEIETESKDGFSYERESENGDVKSGIQGEKLNPRKELPPLLLPLTEAKAPRLDWLGTSFGLTAELHRFWRRSGMRMLYLRQTKNELTGEHSAILVRALPKRTGFDDAWLPAFVADSQRRIISLLRGSFRDMSVKLAASMLEDFQDYATGRNEFSNNDDVNVAIEKRAGSSSDTISLTELNCILTPFDLKRIEQYGRNLCDHHLVTDLLPSIARLYFTGRLGPDFKLSSLQAALLCGIGLQSKTVDSLTAEVGLPANQVLAMFNKSIRKTSIAFHSIVERSEKAALLRDSALRTAEKKAEKIKDVKRQTLEEGEEDSAKSAVSSLREQTRLHLPLEVLKDSDTMQHVVKGTDEQWSEALKNKETNKSTVQIKAVRKTPPKRKLHDGDIEKGTGALSFGRKKSFIKNDKN